MTLAGHTLCKLAVPCIDRGHRRKLPIKADFVGQKNVPHPRFVKAV